MLMLRPEQWAVFEQQARERFRARALAHVRRCWSRQAEQLGPERLPAYVDAAIAGAEGRGLEAERDVLLYIDLCLLFDTYPDCSCETPMVTGLWERSDLPAPTRLRIVWRKVKDRARAAAQRAGEAIQEGRP